MLKLKLTPLCIAICLTGGAVSSAFAQTSDDQQRKIDQLIRKVNARTAELESEIKSLKSQVAELKKQNVKQDRTIQRVAAEKTGFKAYGPGVLQLGAMPVITSPYVGDAGSGVNIAPDGLTITFPSHNLDLSLLRHQQRMDKAFTEMTGVTKPPHPLLELSGRVEAQAWASRNANSSRSSDIDVTSAELDLTSRAGNWVTGFVAMVYDNAPTAAGSARVTNSRMFIDKAFITIGNLNESPFYGSIGQRHVQFGQYANPFVTGPYTRTLGRTKARQISVSYQHPGNSGLYATLFTFRGDSRVSQNINQLGGSVGYEVKQNNWKLNVGVDYITNIADSEGIQRAFNNANPAPNGNQLANRVPGVSLHGKLDVGAYTLIAEYIGATTKFNPANVSVNNVGAKPQALHLAAAYKYTGLWNRPSEVAIGYNRARDTQAFGIPETRWSIAHNMVILKNTILGLELRRDKNYNATDTASIQGRPINTAPSTFPFGAYSNTLTAQLTYLF